MKLRKFWSVGGGRAPGAPPLDPPLFPYCIFFSITHLGKIFGQIFLKLDHLGKKNPQFGERFMNKIWNIC